jgi:hypothetical protein
MERPKIKEPEKTEEIQNTGKQIEPEKLAELARILDNR